MPSLQLVAVLGSALPVVWPRRSRASLVPSRPASGEWMSVNIAPSSGTERSIRESQRTSSPPMYRLSFSVRTVMASTILRPPSAGSEQRVINVSTDTGENDTLSESRSELRDRKDVSNATCRQTRAIRDSSCEAGELSYEVASDVSTDTGDQRLIV